MNKKLLLIMLVACALLLSACASGDASKKLVSGGSSAPNQAPVIDFFEFYKAGCGNSSVPNGTINVSCQLNYIYTAHDDFGIISFSYSFFGPNSEDANGTSFPSPGLPEINNSGSFQVSEKGEYYFTIRFTDAQGRMTAENRSVYVQSLK